MSFAGFVSAFTASITLGLSRSIGLGISTGFSSLALVIIFDAFLASDLPPFQVVDRHFRLGHLSGSVVLSGIHFHPQSSHFQTSIVTLDIGTVYRTNSGTVCLICAYYTQTPTVGRKQIETQSYQFTRGLNARSLVAFRK